MRTRRTSGWWIGCGALAVLICCCCLLLPLAAGAAFTSSTLSNLQDLDYAKAITDMQRKQLELEAAQKSFANISQLSLFNYI